MTTTTRWQPPQRGLIPFRGKWMRFTESTLKKWRETKGKEWLADYAVDRNIKRIINPLSYFLPHGVPRHDEPLEFADGLVTFPPSEYPEKYANDGVAFVNDWQNDVAMLVSGRKFGKSYTGAGKVAMLVCKTDPTWAAFTEHGIDPIEWTGPKIAVIGSFSLQNVSDLWNVYSEVLPREELGPYAPGYGTFPWEKGKPRRLAFGSGRPQDITLEKSGSKLVFLTYTQHQGVWESFKSHLLHADEQIPKRLFLAWRDGTRAMGTDYTPVFFTLSGFKLRERPDDTGASGWVKRELWDGEKPEEGAMDLSVGRYNLSINSTPEVFVTKKRRESDIWRWEHREELNMGLSEQRRLVATLWGGWEEGAGRVFGLECWQRDIHVIEPLWKDNETPGKEKATLWRVIDYGDSGVTCCSWFAVLKNYAVLYRLLYERDMHPAQTARKIIEMSHNTQIKVGTDKDLESGDIRMFHEERIEPKVGEEYYRTILDSRSFAQRQQGETVGDLFSRYGLECEPTSGEQNFTSSGGQIPALKDWLTIDWTKPHPWRKQADGEPFMGRPMLYFFALPNIIQDAVGEIEGLGVHPNDESKINPKNEHHFIDTAKYWASDGPTFMGDEDNEVTEPLKPLERTPYTGF